MSTTHQQTSAAGEILLVEDIPESMTLLTDILQGAGYQVRQAQDGQMALATVQSQLPDLILLDIAMPEINGYEVCRKIKENPASRDVPVIFLSAFHDTEYKLQGFMQGAVDFITKPYHPEEILVRVRTHIELGRLRADLERRVHERTAELEATASALQQEMRVRRKVEDGLRLSAKVFETTFSGVMITDDKGVIVAVNPAFTRITGYSPADALGNSPRILKSGQHDLAFYQQMWQGIHATGSWSAEVWNRRKDGNVVPMMETIYEFKEGGRVTNYIAMLADLSESKDAQTLINFLAYRDGLTGLPNRMVARKHFEQAVADADMQGHKVGVLCLDLDRFKVINDSLGHLIGDQLLKMLAAKFTSCLGENTMISREGGDEFLMIASSINAIETLNKLAQRIIDGIKQEFVVDGHALSVTASIGIAQYPDDGATFEDLLRGAENALYHSKKKGGNDFCHFTNQMDTEARMKMEVENCLRGAVTNGELQVVYQPKVAVGTGLIVGAEALVRWNNPVLGFVSPANFIPLAEESGLILAIDEWVLNTVCGQIRQWMDAGLGQTKVSVNLSTLQFRRGDLSALVQRVLNDKDILASCLDLEITESVLMENIQSAVSILDDLKQIGVSISLDDFGTGYSSLSYLRKLPIDTLKIDKSFVDEIHVQSSNAMIARAVIALGHNLGLSVVAEGVENREQFDFLREHDCDEIQGYFFSKPLPADDFARLLNSNLMPHGHDCNARGET
jgi:diguanylate cyclase (GGDEF)-like protein/PAS domain S-box-containing protein